MYLARLLGHDYIIQYRAENHNKVVEALSRLLEKDPSLFMILFVPSLTFLEELRRQLNAHPDYTQRRQDIIQNPANFPTFTVSQDLVMTNGRIWLPRGLPITSILLVEYHTTPTGGHAGITKTLARISENFSWLGLWEDVKQFVTNCLDCQVTKYETQRVAGLLCPLPVPHRPWEDLSLNFIVGLPPYHGNTIILVVVDRFLKGIHLGMLPTSHTTHMVASMFVEVVVKIHGVPRSLVSDRDPLFINRFWQELFGLAVLT